ILADNPDQKINLKMFHGEIQNDHEAIKNEEAAYQMIPVIDNVTAADVEEVYKKIKAEVKELVINELEKLSPQNKDQEDKSVENQAVNKGNQQSHERKKGDVPLDHVGPI